MFINICLRAIVLSFMCFFNPSLLLLADSNDTFSGNISSSLEKTWVLII